MKHACPGTLLELLPLLVRLRACEVLRERSPGAFYRRGAAFLHFHEDPLGVFADLRVDARGFQRYPVNTEEERATLFELVSHALRPAGR